MHRELAFAFHHIEGVAEVFHSSLASNRPLFITPLRRYLCIRLTTLPSFIVRLRILIHGHMPYMKFLSVRSDICRRLPSDFNSRWTPLPLTIQFPLLGLTRDLHPLDNAHAERTKKKRHPEVPNVSFFILLSAPEACLYRSRLPTKTFVANHA